MGSRIVLWKVFCFLFVKACLGNWHIWYKSAHIQFSSHFCTFDPPSNVSVRMSWVLLSNFKRELHSFTGNKMFPISVCLFLLYVYPPLRTYSISFVTSDVPAFKCFRQSEYLGSIHSTLNAHILWKLKLSAKSSRLICLTLYCELVWMWKGFLFTVVSLRNLSYPASPVVVESWQEDVLFSEMSFEEKYIHIFTWPCNVAHRRMKLWDVPWQGDVLWGEVHQHFYSALPFQ